MRDQKNWKNKKLLKIFKPKPEEEILELINKFSPDVLLFKSAKFGFVKGVHLAIEKGVNVHVNFDSALYAASINGHLEVIKVILRSETKVYEYDNNILYFAQVNEHEDIVDELLKNGFYDAIKIQKYSRYF